MAFIGAGVAVAVPLTASAAPQLIRLPALSVGSAPLGSIDLGSVPPSQPVNFSVVLAPSDPSGLQSLLQNLYTPGSPQYQQWLQPGQFDQEFGPSALNQFLVQAWLHAKGLTSTSFSGFDVDVSAPASVVASALGVTLDLLKAPSGQIGYVAQQIPQIPSTLAGGQIVSVLGLNSFDQFLPEESSATAPSSTESPRALPPNADGLTACSAAQALAARGFDTLPAVGGTYGIGSLLANGQNGRGQTIGIYELAAHSASDVATYAHCFGLTNPVTTIGVDGGGTTGGLGTGEADLDIEQAMSQAPGASVISYEGPNGSAAASYDIWKTIVSTDVAKVVSTSWGECEPMAKADGYIPSFSTLFQQAAAQGQSIIAAAGDTGAEDCYGNNRSVLPEVDYPASDPYVTAVGGTTRNSNGTETVWNDCQANESTACATPNAGAGGGGLSRYEGRAGGQPNAANWSAAQPCGVSCREVPDISANAGVGMVVFALGGWTEDEGTSFVAPLIAGLVADKNVGCATLTGNFAGQLYSLASRGAYGTAFNDITSGNNDLTGSNHGSLAAGSGYDLATGLGSPIAAGLSCPEITGVGGGTSGQQVTVTGLGLERATISFGGKAAQVVAAGNSSATVVVPPGSGTVMVSATGPLGAGRQAADFTYSGSPATAAVALPAQPSAAQLSSPHGFWLVSSDGGVFTFGGARFFGSAGTLHLQRPVVGITPTAGHAGYWLVASDGGVFTYGNAGYYGSIPGLGLAPAGSSGPGKKLNAPIVGMVPTINGAGYFMVASDGGVFAFGNAKFEGSCPSIGGCAGSAVSVVPDATGNGYWLYTSTGRVYAFGDATNYGSTGQEPSPITAAARTADGKGYWVLSANGIVSPFGDAVNHGDRPNATGGFDPADAIVTTSDGGGYWVMAANGTVFPFGDAPDLGTLAGTPLVAPIVAATGW
ncbi:MAG TPA: protease pro-enzyme activation domain-containing protein [Acidimicrobiales bacterium]|nr:protease pro-enzyme activation domain-containing protein [Acidimicrobiales bacterium]